MSYHTRVIRRLNEVERRRGRLTTAQAAIRSFHRSLEANRPARTEDVEDERRVRMCTAEDCSEQYSTEDDKQRVCPYCGAKLADVEDSMGVYPIPGRGPVTDEDEDEKRTRTSDPRRGARAGEAIRAFKSQYKRLRS